MMPVLTNDVEATPERHAESVANALIRLAGTAVFRAADGRLHAQVPVANRHEVYSLKSKDFREWLVEAYRYERGEFPAASERLRGWFRRSRFGAV